MRKKRKKSKQKDSNKPNEIVEKDLIQYIMDIIKNPVKNIGQFTGVVTTSLMVAVILVLGISSNYILYKLMKSKDCSILKVLTMEY